MWQGGGLLRHLASFCSSASTAHGAHAVAAVNRWLALDGLSRALTLKLDELVSFKVSRGSITAVPSAPRLHLPPMARPRTIDDQRILTAARDVFYAAAASADERHRREAGVSEGSIFALRHQRRALLRRDASRLPSARGRAGARAGRLHDIRDRLREVGGVGVLPRVVPRCWSAGPHVT